MSDTRKIEEQTKEELLKDCELSLEDLGKVTGGGTGDTGGVFEQNPDGTYNLYDGQEFNIGRTCQVTGTYLNATLNTAIHFEYYEEHILPTGEWALDMGHRTCTLGYIISNLD